MAVIPLTQGKVALVDDADAGLVSERKWHALRRGRTAYAQHCWAVGGVHKSVLMHRLILNPAPGCLVDHINGNGLDNRRSNLRLATAAENCTNRKPHGEVSYVGVTKARNGWKASIAPHRIDVFLGIWPTRELAAAAYNVAARKLFREFATINPVPELPPGAWESMLLRKRDRFEKLRFELDTLWVE